MKKLVLLLLSISMVCSLFCVSTSAAAAETFEKSYKAPYGVPTIDGIIDPIWSIAPWDMIDVDHTAEKSVVRFKVLHDDNLIYFLVEAVDPAVSGKKNECVQLRMHSHACSNPDGCKQYTTELMIAGSGTIWSETEKKSLDNSNFKVMATQDIGGTKYVYEWAFKPTDAIPKNSTGTFDIEWLYDDYNADSKWLPSQVWNNKMTTGEYVNNPANFGKLYFMTKDETPQIDPVTFYNDVPTTHSAYDAIVYASSRGIFVPASSSNPSFYPDQKLTRAQFVTALGRLAGADVSRYTKTSFTDVNFTRDAWFARYAEWAKAVGLTVGTEFMANKTISVAEAVVMLQRFADNIDNKYVPSSLSLFEYSDAASVPSWAKAGMQWAVKNGIYAPTGKALSPSATVNRAMTAQLIYNYESVLTYGNVEGKPGVSVSEPPSDIDWDSQFEINALDFGFVNDGKTYNDGIMAYYIEHYSSKIPLVFPAGKYVFRYQINFPDRIYIELAPRAEWILMSDTVQNYFVTLQEGYNTTGTEWGTWDEYSHQSYIRGGTINANYNAKVGLGLSHGFHTNFADFMLKNVLEKGIMTEINGHCNGYYTFNNVYLYNEKGIEGTIGYYDNSPDNTYTRCTTVNFQYSIYTHNGMFTQCSGWFNSAGKVLIPNSAYAIVENGHQSVFNNPLIDTYRRGFILSHSANGGGNPSTTINNLVWINNGNFYSAEMLKQYPLQIFEAASDNCKFMVNGLYFPWIEYGSSFSNIQLPSSSFLNVRYPAGWKPWTKMANFRDDSAMLRKLINPYDWSGWTN